ncbi:MAG: hypothetical protein GW805_04645 [Ignavibacteria bacterium]|nr:hypothetical protein [Ignavibacteria bacterium]NCS90081.1 hypothetical protein [Ignavibacteria bacterium]
MPFEYRIMNKPARLSRGMLNDEVLSFDILNSLFDIHYSLVIPVYGLNW